MSVRDKLAENPGAYTAPWDPKDRQGSRAAQRKLDAQLKFDLETEHDLLRHPKRDKLWDLAWGEGHSAGHYDVAIWYEQLAELIQP